MNSPLETAVPHAPVASRSAKAAKSKTKSYVMFFTSWVLLIATGVLGTYWYTEHLKRQLAAELFNQTEQQLQSMREEYQRQIDLLKESVTADMGQLKSKVDSFNELLTFVKDSANSKTDNSNQLYTQLQEVKNKLDELQKNLDVLK